MGIRKIRPGSRNLYQQPRN